MFYLDCYCHAASLKNPIVSYCHPDLGRLLQEIQVIESNPMAGINEFRISRTTRSCTPLPLKDEE